MTAVPANARPVGAAEYAAAEDALARLLGTSREVLLLQGEAILALEALARGLGGPGTRVLNVVTGPYGQVIGRWLAAGGAEVQAVAVAFDRAIALESVASALEAGRYDLVSVVHAEAATGVVNPVREIAALAHEAGALVLVDAVASVGAEELAIDAWGLDLVALGFQKALAGPSGVCGVVVSDDGWERIAGNPGAPRDSILSLLDWKRDWLDAGRAALPVIPHHLELRGLETMLAARAAEGIDGAVRRHALARDAARAGLRALGVVPWVASDDDAAAVATLLTAPPGIAPDALLAAARPALADPAVGLLALAPGPLASQALRIGHTGDGARLAAVGEALAALGLGLRTLGREADVGAALAVAVAEWGDGAGAA